MIDYEKSYYIMSRAYDGMARYIEDAEGCCPCGFDHEIEMDKCRACANGLTDSRDGDYNKEMSVKCWKEVFLRGSE